MLAYLFLCSHDMSRNICRKSKRREPFQKWVKLWKRNRSKLLAVIRNWFWQNYKILEKYGTIKISNSFSCHKWKLGLELWITAILILRIHLTHSVFSRKEDHLQNGIFSVLLCAWLQQSFSQPLLLTCICSVICSWFRILSFEWFFNNSFVW